MVTAFFAFTAIVMVAYAAGALWLRAWLAGLVCAALAYDNACIAVGSAIGEGSTLQTLNAGRFWAHALITPLMVVVGWRLAARHQPAIKPDGRAGIQTQHQPGGEAGGQVGIEALHHADGKAGGRVRMVPARRATVGLVALVAALVGYGVYTEIVRLRLEPQREHGTLRYINAAAEGPPVAAIVTIIVLIVFGVLVWRRHRSPWLLTGAVAMFVAAAAGAQMVWLQNVGELALLTGLLVTLWQQRSSDGQGLGG
ncbi:hypothetical protein Rhe02_04830 [Rhizocola hellebori]|uniref:Uncharacterized protein n=1 Tax=Rhizocola hellebori TaxID=1392758 RepID=A0A8J3Q2G2_9ACTN|nr:hypothetical protein [Rhizocola hellebori]GIH02416.1 hypothetical protein Rhe02_04830 [Rhizocola hellebori]